MSNYNNKNYIKFLKEIYYFELDRKDKLNSKLTIPISISIVLFGVLSYFLKNIPPVFNDPIWSIFLIFFFFSAVFAIRSVYFIVRSFLRFTYKYLPSAGVLNSDYQDIYDYYHGEYFDSIETKEKLELIENHIDEIMRENFIECIDQNIQSNDLKNKYISKSINSIIITMILILVTSIPFFINEINSRSNLNCNKIIIERNCNNVER